MFLPFVGRWFHGTHNKTIPVTQPPPESCTVLTIDRVMAWAPECTERLTVNQTGRVGFFKDKSRGRGMRLQRIDSKPT